MTKMLNFGVLIIDLSIHTMVWRLSPFRIISYKYLACFPYEKVVESRHNMLLKALTMHLYCLFFKPEAVSKHSVWLWIGYSVTHRATFSLNVIRCYDVAKNVATAAIGFSIRTVRAYIRACYIFLMSPSLL